MTPCPVHISPVHTIETTVLLLPVASKESVEAVPADAETLMNPRKVGMTTVALAMDASLGRTVNVAYPGDVCVMPIIPFTIAGTAAVPLPW
eukprot:m.774073 g.774073  ORF g.774073 m.774073 type:complete len:91 (-) comp23255_c0_seq1:3801-4073(-)